jgi:general stress protein 26
MGETFMGQSETGHVWEMIKDSHAALLITHDEGGMDARPMATVVRRNEGAIYILANKQEDSDRQIHLDRDVMLSFQQGTSFVVVYGGAEVSDDRRKIRDIWNGFDQAYWDGPDDSRIRLITVTPDRAEYWESPGKLVAYADMLISAATGKQPSTGEHGQVRL